MVTYPGSLDRHIFYPIVGGGSAEIVVRYGTTYVYGKTFETQVPGSLGGACNLPASMNPSSIGLDVVREIVLPQTEPNVERKFTFNYNSDGPPVTVDLPWYGFCDYPPVHITQTSSGWGEVNKMTMPAGAEVNYSYDQISSALGSPDWIARSKIIAKTLTHDGESDTWTYTNGVQAPDGSVTTDYQYPTDPAFPLSYANADGLSGLVYKTDYSGKKTVERRWLRKKFNGANETITGPGVARFNPVVAEEYTTFAGNPSKMSAKVFRYDYNGNVTQEIDYDWFDPSLVTRDQDQANLPTGVPASATVLRVISNSYYNDSTDINSVNVYAKRLIGNPSTNPPSPLILNAPRLATVGPSQTEFHYDGIDNTPPAKGNLTKERHWEGTRWITATHTYDTYGNRLATTDPKGNITTLAYDTATHAQPVSITVDPQNGSGQQTTSTVYDYWTGIPTSVTDPNGKTTSSVYANQLLGTVDPFGRPGIVTDPQGRRAVTRYFDNARQLEVWSDLNSPSDAKLRSRTSADQLGRPIKTESSEDGATYTIFADNVYLQMGKITIATNPTRAQAASADGWTRATKDDIGRVVTVETFGGRYPSGSSTGLVTTSYNANATTVTDQAGKVRRSKVDALGRLARVDEPDSFGNLGTIGNPLQRTDYTYDSRGNLTLVEQGSQTRSFVYDGLSRLKLATNPESGTINYTYDDSGNLQSKTDARGVVTTYGYDGLNRVTSRTYSGPAPGGTTPAVTYVYDTLGAALNGKGRLTSVTSSVSSYSYGSYDVMGRTVTGTQTTDGQNYSMSYQYNLAGDMKSETYPSGRVVITEHDSAGRIAGVKNQASGLYWAGATPSNETNRMQYAAHGAVSAMKLGNGTWEHTNFNSRLQPEQIALGTSSTDSSILKLYYDYGTTTNNGNVLSQKITAPGLTVNQCYGYDALNRLVTAEERSSGTLCSGTQQWKQGFAYDRYGNRNFDVAKTTSNVLGSNPTMSQTTNRFSSGQGYGYDAAGNLTSGPATSANGIVYDADNRQTQYTKTGLQTNYYFYDGDGHRVKKIDGTGTTVFVYNAGGQLIAEYTSGPPAGSGTSYLTSDHLGSTRLVTDSGGNVKARYDYLPFGEELLSSIGSRSSVAGYGAADSTRQKFTQKERDSESGLDYFLARYYSSAQGRFTSIDPYNINLETQMATDPESARSKLIAYLSSPQQWNRYSYVTNNPVKYVDPYGELLEIFGSEEERKKALERIKGVVGEKAAGLLYVREDNGHYYVDYKGKDRDALAATSELGVHIADIIDSDKTVEFHIATTFSAKSSEWFGLVNTVRTHLVTIFGGAATVGAEESLTGNTQIFVHPDAGNVAQKNFGSTFLGGTRSSDGKKLDFYNDIVDAHEFGHAYGNAIKGTPLSGSRASESYPYALRMENYVRARRHMPNRRTIE